MNISDKTRVKWNMKSRWILYLMLVPAFVVTILFSYIPMYGIVIGFQDFNPAFGFIGSPWVGLKWFRFVFNMRDFSSIFWNTFNIAVLKMIGKQVVSLLFALAINEMRIKSMKRSIQTFTYMPHFFSWVVVGGIFIDVLSTDGMINQTLGLFGVAPIFFLGSNTWFQPTMVITEIWKGFGWGSILYLAAISGVNPELYECAYLEGAGRFRRMWYVTLPGIRTTVILLMVLNLSGILDAGFEQILNFYNPSVYATGDIIDTFVYRMGLQQAQYSLATAVSIFKSAIGLVLIVISRRIAYVVADYRIF